MIRTIASDVILDEAFGWLCQRRKDYSPNNDVWDLRRNWDRIKPELQKILLAGDYTFQPLAEFRLTDEIIEMWSAPDALVLKALAMVLSKHLEPILSGRCYHVAGRGGAKAAVRAALEASSGDVHLMKSDIKDYYAHNGPHSPLRTDGEAGDGSNGAEAGLGILEKDRMLWGELPGSDPGDLLGLSPFSSDGIPVFIASR